MHSIFDRIICEYGSRLTSTQCGLLIECFFKTNELIIGDTFDNSNMEIKYMPLKSFNLLLSFANTKSIVMKPVFEIYCYAFGQILFIDEFKQQLKIQTECLKFFSRLYKQIIQLIYGIHHVILDFLDTVFKNYERASSEFEPKNSIEFKLSILDLIEYINFILNFLYIFFTKFYRIIKEHD